MGQYEVTLTPFKSGIALHCSELHYIPVQGNVVHFISLHCHALYLTNVHCTPHSDLAAKSSGNNIVALQFRTVNSGHIAVKYGKL